MSYQILLDIIVSCRDTKGDESRSLACISNLRNYYERYTQRLFKSFRLTPDWHLLGKRLVALQILSAQRYHTACDDFEWHFSFKIESTPGTL